MATLVPFNQGIWSKVILEDDLCWPLMSRLPITLLNHVGLQAIEIRSQGLMDLIPYRELLLWLSRQFFGLVSFLSADLLDEILSLLLVLLTASYDLVKLGNLRVGSNHMLLGALVTASGPRLAHIPLMAFGLLLGVAEDVDF